MLRINSAGFFHTPPGWSLTPERTRLWPDLNLWHLVSGSGRLEHREGTIPLRAGTCLLLRGGEDYTFHLGRGQSFRHYWLHFHYIDADGRPLPPERSPAPGLARRLAQPQLLELLLARIAENARSGRLAETDNLIWLEAALAEIAAADRREGATSTDEEPYFAPWLDELCAAIRARPEESRSVEALAKELGVCRSYLYKLFLRRFGRSPRQMVLEERMRAARELLRESSNRIDWIAQRLGYRDVFFFSRQFKTYHGQSPSDFRSPHAD